MGWDCLEVEISGSREAKGKGVVEYDQSTSYTYMKME
jgi:hypothetical protein